MRRKGLLAVIFVVFFASGILSYHAMYGNARKAASTTPSYITIEKWGQPESEIEIPRTGGLEEASFFSVITPQQVIDLTVPDTNNDSSMDATYDDVLQPEDLVTVSASASAKRTKIKTNFFYNLLLAVMSLVVLSLGGYLTYQHFMR